MGRMEEQIEVNYYIVDSEIFQATTTNEILPEGTYFFLLRPDGSVLHYIIGILDDEQKILYVDLTDGRSHRWKDEVDFEVLDERIYSVPVKITTTSTILRVPVANFPHPQGLLHLNL